MINRLIIQKIMDNAVQIQLYLQQTYLYQHHSKIIELKQTSIEEAKTKEIKNFISILLKENIFHPQGGGQPNDEGWLKFGEIVDLVPVVNIVNKREEQRVYLEIVHNDHHWTQLQALEQNQGIVEQIVNNDKRRLYAQLHSAGHLLDIAVKRLGIKWIPGKGFHFPEGAYVEYIGSLDGYNLEEVRKQIEDSCAIIQDGTDENNKRQVKEMNYLNEQQLIQKMGEIPEYLKGMDNVRYIELSTEDSGCPCGGTHVEHLKEIGQLKISKIQKKGKNIRVSYSIK